MQTAFDSEIGRKEELEKAFQWSNQELAFSNLKCSQKVRLRFDILKTRGLKSIKQA
jgi:hypothetical protein